MSIEVNIYCWLCTYTNPIFGKILVLELQAKRLSASEIAGFLIQLYPKKKLMNQLDFWLDEKDSRNMVGLDQQNSQPIMLQNF